MGVLQRWRRDAVVLLYLTIPLALLAAGFLILGKTTGGGWSSLDYLVYAIATGAAWAIAMLGYLGWTV